MELGIFAEVSFSGEVTPREVVRSRSKVEEEVKSNSKSVHQDNSVYGNVQLICLNELAHGAFARLCLS